MEADNYIYKNGNISVDGSLIKIGSASYSVASIGSTTILKAVDPAQIWLAFFGGIIVLVGFGFYVIPGIIFAFIWYKLAKKAPWYKYTVLIKNSSGDHPALEKADLTAATQLHQAIERAISAR
ncbi:DUF6232 family protein [Acetobacter persici]|uniref:QacE n=1 Tax=Acetobacter persici TaxID=1076596 RepID=A0A6V8ICV3_9PROT|nr:DUF6232 family protein [Acetobacter persici]GFE94922.1 hypothetical protein DmAi_29810 [Acetobacter persici]